jgi:hypothetical protein
MKRVFVLALRDDFDESKYLTNIQLENVNTGEEHGFRTLSEFHQWLHGIANQDLQGNRTKHRLPKRPQ